jgi:hypothetical protein
MNAVNTLLFAVGLATALACMIVLVLRRPFLHLLVELCRSEVHGTFWYVFACISIVLTTLLGSLLAFAPGEFANFRESGALDASLAIFRAGLIGLVLSLGGVALAALVTMAQRPDPAKSPPVLPRPNA